MTGETYGIIINEYSDSFGKDIVIKWENGNTTQTDVNNITIIDDNTDILNPGIFIDLTGEHLSKNVIISNHIPELDHYSGSWVVSSKDGSIIGEFYERSNVEKFNPETCIIETSLQYLQRVNRDIEEGNSMPI